MSDGRLDDDAVREALELVDWPGKPTSIRAVGDGVNDVFVVSTTGETPTTVVCKFATFSTTANFWAGVQSNCLLRAHTALPVPEVYEFRTDPPSLPPFQIQEYLPGDSLPGPSEAVTLSPVRALGAVIGELGSVPSAVSEGYGTIMPPESDETVLTSPGDAAVDELVVNGEYEDCRQWLLSYSISHYEDPPDHDALASVAPAVPRYYEENASRLPSDPAQSVVLTDFGPSNLLAPGGTLPEGSGLDDLTGVLDLERAKLGPLEFTAVNAEYLVSRWMENTVVDALYDSLPFGPDIPNRDLYRLVAMGRSVNSLAFWYEEDDEQFQQRGAELARQIEEIV